MCCDDELNAGRACSWAFSVSVDFANMAIFMAIDAERPGGTIFAETIGLKYM